MANEIHFPYLTGRILYALRFNRTGQVLSGATYVAFVPASWATYALPLVESGSSGHYFADFTVTADNQVDIYDQASVAPAMTDVLVGQGDVAPDYATAAMLTDVQTDVDELQTSVAGLSATGVTLVSPTTIQGSDITGLRGDRWSISLTGLGSLAGRTKTWFTVKASTDDADDAAILEITEAGGLVRLNGSAVLPAGITSASAAITVTNETTGAVTITIEAAVAALFDTSQLYSYDIQVLTGTAVATKVAGTLKAAADVKRATA